MSRKRDNTLDILKGIGIITMVMGHSNMGESFNSYVAGFHMQLFFIVSGYLFNQSKYSFIDYTKRKAQTLLLPYISFAIITLLYCLILSYIKQSNIYNFPECLIGIIYSNRSIFPITGALWFLQCLFLVNIIFYACGKCGEYVRLSFMLIFFLGAWVQSYYDIWLPFALDSALSAIILFYIGFLFQRITINITNPSSTLLLSIILLVLTYFTIKWNGDVNPRTCTYGHHYFVYFVNAVLATLGWYFASAIIEKLKRIGMWFSIIGQDSIVFVGLNQVIISTLYQLCLLFHSFPNPTDRAIRNICICALTLVILKSITDIINKSKYRFLIGK